MGNKKNGEKNELNALKNELQTKVNELKAVDLLIEKYQTHRGGISKAIKHLEIEVAKLQPMSLSDALAATIDGRSNHVGYKVLKDLTETGEWKGTGLSYRGEVYRETSRRVLTIEIDRNMSEAEINRLESVVKIAVSSITQGINIGNRYTGKSQMVRIADGADPSSRVPLSEIRFFDVRFDPPGPGSRVQLGAMPDGRWLICDSEQYGYSRAKFVGSLRENIGALLEMRNNNVLRAEQMEREALERQIEEDQNADNDLYGPGS